MVVKTFGFLWRGSSSSQESDTSGGTRCRMFTGYLHRECTVGQIPVILRHYYSLITFPTSEGVSEVSEQANEWAQRSVQAKQAVRSKQTSERCERMSKRTSEWPSTYIWVLGGSGPQWNVTFLGTGQKSLTRRMIDGRQNCLRGFFHV